MLQGFLSRCCYSHFMKRILRFRDIVSKLLTKFTDRKKLIKAGIWSQAIRVKNRPFPRSVLLHLETRQSKKRAIPPACISYTNVLWCSSMAGPVLCVVFPFLKMEMCSTSHPHSSSSLSGRRGQRFRCVDYQCLITEPCKTHRTGPTRFFVSHQTNKA